MLQHLTPLPNTKIKPNLLSMCLVLFAQLFLANAMASQAREKPRLIILTDIGGGDPDDEQSMVRLMLYSNKFDIEALVAGSNLRIPGKSKPHMIEDIVNAYGQVRNNLLAHETGFPPKDSLLSKIKTGQPWDGIDYVGATFDTEGSDAIIDIIDSPDPRPVHISIWGGATDLAQALWRVKNDRSLAEVNDFISRIRISWMEQGVAGVWPPTAVMYIKNTFPSIWQVSYWVRTGENHYIHNPARGMYLGGDQTSVMQGFLNTHIAGHGPLSDLYPRNAAGWEGTKEGDTPTWFYFLENGLSNINQPTWGGWGGRFFHEVDNLYAPTKDIEVSTNGLYGRATVNRWRNDFQNEFAARMDWCTTTNFSGANHSPISRLSGCNFITASPGETIVLDASLSTDPDEAASGLRYEWFQYKEAGTFNGTVSITNSTSSIAQLVVPSTHDGETMHVILRVQDNGTPTLHSYQRIVITIDAGVQNNSCMTSGDLNDDGLVDFEDFLLLAANFDKGTQLSLEQGDLTDDGLVNFDDFLIFADNFGLTCCEIGSKSAATGQTSGKTHGKAHALFKKLMDKKKQKFLVFPNPSQGRFTIKGISSKEVDRLFITNILGEVVFESSYTEMLNLSALSEGMYIINIETVSKDLIKESIQITK